MCRALLLIASVSLFVPGEGLVGARKATPRTSVDAMDARKAIGKVVGLLQKMKERVDMEGKREKKLYTKYMCFCKTGTANLQETKTSLTVKQPQSSSMLATASSQKDRLDAELKTAKDEREYIQDRITRASAVRDHEAEAYQKQADQDHATIRALAKAMKALKSGGEINLLQKDVSALKLLSQSETLVSEARDTVKAVLAGQVGDQGSVDEILGILKTIAERLKALVAQADAEEQKHTAEFASLMEASKHELKAVTEKIATRITRLGEVRLTIVNTEQEIDAMTNELDRDMIFKQDMERACGSIADAYEAHVESRAEELVTLTSTIEVLNKDESLQLFKGKDDKEPMSFMQVSSKQHQQHPRAHEALRLLRAVKRSRHRGSAQLDIILLALKGKKANFKKIIQKVLQMSDMLKKEQAGDDLKRERCTKQLRRSRLDQKSIVDQQVIKSVKRNEDAMVTVEEDIGELVGSIQKLDGATQDSNAQRKENHKGFSDTLMLNQAALKVIVFAKQRLLKFYNQPVKKYSDPENAVSTKLNPNEFGPGAMATMAGMTSLEQEDAEEDDGPEDVDRNMDRQQASGGVVEMLGRLEFEINRDTVEARAEERNHAAAYETMRKDAMAERATMAESLMEKTGRKSMLEVRIHKMRGRVTNDQRQKEAAERYLQQLHADCDFLLANYDIRQRARTTEREALQRVAQLLSQ